jgi:UDP-glucose 4-epimerase
MTRALVTGGAGFIGSHLVDLLVTQGYDVTVLDDYSSGFENNIQHQSVRIVRGDVKDWYLVLKCSEGCDLIFDFAAYHPNIIGHIMKQASDEPAKDAAETLTGIINILEAARISKSKVIFASTAAVYGEPSENPVQEMKSIAPISPYGVSKYCGELYCKFYHEAYGVPVFIGRIFNSYGPRMHKYLLFDVMEKLSRNQKQLKLFGTGDEIRDFIFVKDTANAFYYLSQSDYVGQPVNIGTGIGIKVHEIVEMLFRSMGLGPEIEFTGTSWLGNTKKIIADVTRLRRTGWAQQYTLKDGIRLFVDWYNHQPNIRIA